MPSRKLSANMELHVGCPLKIPGSVVSGRMGSGILKSRFSDQHVLEACDWSHNSTPLFDMAGSRYPSLGVGLFSSEKPRGGYGIARVT